MTPLNGFQNGFRSYFKLTLEVEFRGCLIQVQQLNLNNKNYKNLPKYPL